MTNDDKISPKRWYEQKISPEIRKAYRRWYSQEYGRKFTIGFNPFEQGILDNPVFQYWIEQGLPGYEPESAKLPPGGVEPEIEKVLGLPGRVTLPNGATVDVDWNVIEEGKGLAVPILPLAYATPENLNYVMEQKQAYGATWEEDWRLEGMDWDTFLYETNIANVRGHLMTFYNKTEEEVNEPGILEYLGKWARKRLEGQVDENAMTLGALSLMQYPEPVSPPTLQKKGKQIGVPYSGIPHILRQQLINESGKDAYELYQSDIQEINRAWETGAPVRLSYGKMFDPRSWGELSRDYRPSFMDWSEEAIRSPRLVKPESFLEARERWPQTGVPLPQRALTREERAEVMIIGGKAYPKGYKVDMPESEYYRYMEQLQPGTVAGLPPGYTEPGGVGETRTKTVIFGEEGGIPTPAKKGISPAARTGWPESREYKKLKAQWKRLVQEAQKAKETPQRVVNI